MPQKKQSQRGVVMVLVALIATAIFGFVGLAFDAGNLHWTKLRAQTAADSAAIAALREYQAGSAGSKLVDAGRNDAGLNGFTNAENDTTVTINRPPVSGSMAGDNQAVEAIVSRQVPSMFLRFLGVERSTVAARAVAKLGWGGGCIYALNKTDPDSLQLGGNETTVIPCDALAASTHAGGFRMNGGAQLFVKNNARVGVVGGWVFDGGATIRDYTTNAIKMPTHVLAVKDPFSGRPQPSLAGLTVRSMKRKDGTFDANSAPPDNAIPPGI